MRKLAGCLVVWLVLGGIARAQQDVTPILDGYVTRVVSGSDFDVDGVRVLCNGETQAQSPQDKQFYLGCPEWKPTLAEPLAIYGTQKQHAVLAERIALHGRGNAEVSGSAVIDAEPRRICGSGRGGNTAGVSGCAQNDTEVLVRADGYPILLTAKTKMRLDDPLRSIADVRANLWMRFQGRQRADGVVVAKNAWIGPEMIGKKEQKLLMKTNFDPSKATKKQNPVAEAVLGTDYGQIPAVADAAMQARIARVGEKLIPDYQKQLPDSDPTKIHFRFVLVDERYWHDSTGLPSGLILVPYQVVDRMQNDSQLAAVLADSIAWILDKEIYRHELLVGYPQEVNALSWAVLAGSAAVPGIGLINEALEARSIAGSVALLEAQEQTERVSLDLMHDAGYDITQAPLAWWLLAPLNAKPLNEIAIPERARWVYHMLSTTWPEVTSGS